MRLRIYYIGLNFCVNGGGSNIFIFSPSWAPIAWIGVEGGVRLCV